MKCLLKDKDNNVMLPITRGELVLDSSGNMALHSLEFLATTERHGLISMSDKAKLDSMAGGAIDDKLDINSANPVQNKVLTQIINSIKEKYIKAVNISGNKLTITDLNDSTVDFFGSVYSIVTNTTDGLVPKFDSVDGTIDNQAEDWILTNHKGNLGWYKLPLSTFAKNTTSIYIGDDVSESNASTTNGSTYLKFFENSTLKHKYKIQGSGSTVVTSDSDGNLNIYNPTTFASNQVDKLTDYVKGTSVESLQTTDTLNKALGKLECKADVTYNLVKGAYDGDGTIENLEEILKVLDGIKDTDTIQSIIGKYLPLSGGTMLGSITINHDATSSAQIIYKNNRLNDDQTGGWADNIIIHTNASGTPTARIGVLGDKQDLSYLFLGHNIYNATNNLRIYNDHASFGNNMIYNNYIAVPLILIIGDTHPHILGNNGILTLGGKNSLTEGSVVCDSENNAFRRNSASTNITLGTNTYRWGNFFGTTGNFTGKITFPLNTGIYYDDLYELLGVASKGQWTGHPGNDNYYTFVGTPSYDTILRAKGKLYSYRNGSLYEVLDSGNLFAITKLHNFYSERQTSLKPAIIGDGSMYQFKSTYVVTDQTDDPGEGHILHFEWDNNGGYSSQLFIRNHDGLLKTRGMNGKDADGNARWGNWKEVVYQGGTFIGNVTGNLTGNVTGNVTGTVTGNASTATQVYINNSNGNGGFPLIFTNIATAGTPLYNALYTAGSNTLHYNPNTLTLTTQNFAGNLTGIASLALLLQSRGKMTSNFLTGSNKFSDTGLSLVEAHKNYVTNGPANFGNVLLIKGKDIAGCGELFLEWTGSTTPGNLYYRSQRDMGGTDWSLWTTLLSNYNYTTYTLPRTQSMSFQHVTEKKYVNASFVDPTLSKVAVEKYIEFWDGANTNAGFDGGYFNGEWGKLRAISGYESLGKIALLGTTADTSWISFNRSGAAGNYITWPGDTDSACLLAFGYGNQYAQSYYYMSNKALYPAQTSNTLTLGTSSNRWNNIFSKEGNYTGNLTLYSASGDSPHLVFLRANIDDGTWDWDQYVSGGVWYLRQNSVNNTPNKWLNIVSASDTIVNIHKKLSVVGDTELNGSLHKFTSGTSGMSSYLASFNSTASSVTGAIKITLPTSWSSAMAMYEIKIYEYDSPAGSTLLVSGYNYSSGSYYNVKYTVVGEYNKGVSFAHDGANCCILLGNTTSTWKYPLIFLSNVYGGYSGGKSVLKSGYTISVLTDDSGLTKVNCPKAAIDATTATRLVRQTPLDASHTLYYYSGQPEIGEDANKAKAGSNAWNLFSYPAGGTPANTVANIISLRMLWSTLYLHEIFASPNNRQLWHRWINLGTTKPWSRIVLEDNDSESTTYKLNVDGKASKIALNKTDEWPTYGDYGEIVQSTKNGPTGSWHNSLKILHNNSAGYYTQLALTFTGEEGLWHRRCTAGTRTEWKKVIDSDGGTLNKNLYFNHDTTNYALLVFKNTRIKDGTHGWADSIITLQNNSSSNVALFGMYGSGPTLSYLYLGTGEHGASNNLRIYSDKLGAMPIQPNVTNSYDLGTSTLRWNTLYANRCNLVTKGLQWVGGKTLSNAAIEIATKQTASAYFPIMAVKTSGDHVVNIGGLGDYVGFYGYYSSRTNNGTDWEFYFNASNGSIISRSTSDFIRRGGNFVLENTSGGETPHLVFRRGTSTDTAVDFDMYSNSGYLYLRGGSTSLGTLLSLTTSSISIPLTTTIGTSTSNKNLTVYGTTSSTKLTLTQSTGTAPMTISSTTVVTNLNADMVDGKHASDFAIPVGTIMMWAGSTAPTGWLLCNGAAVSRTTYSSLFAVISTTYGTGNGRTTFNVPNLVQRFPLGADTQGLIGLDSSRNGYDTTLGKSGGSATHTLTVSELPSHRHSFTALRDNTRVSGKGADVNNTLGIHPSSGYTGYSGLNYAHNNIPPFLAVNFIIKY